MFHLLNLTFLKSHKCKTILYLFFTKNRLFRVSSAFIKIARINVFILLDFGLLNIFRYMLYVSSFIEFDCALY